jgi:hypothetical protein
MHHFHGYSISAVSDLCEKHGYIIAEVEYNNVFLLPREIAKTDGLSSEEAYQRGYWERADRREKFPQNENMAVMNDLSAEDKIKFLEKFFEQHNGKYEMWL